MEAEHCGPLYGADVPFTTTNYGLTTTPRAEYAIATGRAECPEAARKDLSGRVVRVRERGAREREGRDCRTRTQTARTPHAHARTHLCMHARTHTHARTYARTHARTLTGVSQPRVGWLAHGPRDAPTHTRTGQVVRPVEELVGLRQSQEAQLGREEVVAVVSQEERGAGEMRKEGGGGREGGRERKGGSEREEAD